MFASAVATTGQKRLLSGVCMMVCLESLSITLELQPVRLVPHLGIGIESETMLMCHHNSY